MTHATPVPPLRSAKLPYKLLLRVFPLHTWRVLVFEFHMTVVRLRSRKARRALSGLRDQLVNVGCGDSGLPGWVNVDVYDAPGVSCVFDCRTSLPLEPNSARVIYAEHFFEHLDRFDEAPLFLAACLQALRPGGVLRIVVPDAEKYVRAYCSEDGWAALTSFSPLVPSDQPQGDVTTMDIVNHHFRQGHQHKWAYDYETLETLIRTVGFARIVRSEYNTSTLSYLRIDSPTRRAESLYVEAIA
jgi:predicted SAM-dependent methyltransferase